MAIRIEPNETTHVPLRFEGIPALGSLLSDLTQHRIRYCSWKSNEHLNAGLSGRTDVDLLIDAADASGFRQILRRHDVRSLIAKPDLDFPGMEHFLGFDRASGRLFHLHVHTELVLGEQHVKNHRVPLVRAFLDSTRLLDGVPVPPPELELAVLSVRVLLKYRARDVVKDVLKIRTPGIREPIRRELHWLMEQTTIEQVGTVLERTGDVLPRDVVTRFLETFDRDPRSGWGFFRLRGLLRRRIGRLQRRARPVARLAFVRASWRHRRRLRWRPYDGRMTPGRGGATIALVGADGSGKSTVAAELVRWLGWKLEVRSYYLGSKSPSWRSRFSYLTFRAMRRTHRAASRRFGSGSAVARPPAWARDVALALHHLATHRDRAKRYRAGRRDAEAGRVVVFDRMPLFMLSERAEHRVFDGPGIASAPGRSSGRLLRTLADAEEHRYRAFAMPDLLVVLQVGAETAMTRKPDHRPEVVAAKSLAADELLALAQHNGGSTRVIGIDAHRPLEHVLDDVKRSVWDAL